MKKKNTLLKAIIIIVIAVAIIVGMSFLFSSMNAPKPINYDGDGGLLQKLEGGEIKALYISGNYKVYILYNGSKIEDKNFPNKADAVCVIGSRTQFEARLAAIKASGKASPVIKFDDPSKNSNITSMIFPAITVILMVIFIVMIFRQSSGGGNKAMNFGKNKARLSTDTKIKFGDVAGAEEEKEELKEIVEFLKNPKKFSDLGARIPKGVLLVGPPGTGKTLFAKAIAGEAEVPFFSISGSDFVEMFVGTGAARVRDLFEQAKHNMPCIIFIDEIDAVGRQRGAGLGGGNDEREQTLNQLLVQMDGFEKNEGIIIIAATNRADILDPALMRPGRFDRQIYVSPPDVKGREAILKVHARNKPLSPEVSYKILARMTSGFTGADIANLLNEAAILAARANRKIIIMEDILEGINKVIAGPQKKSRVVTETDKRITAYHEAGHAILSKKLPNCDEVQEVSIIPRGMAAGYTLTRPDSDDNHVTRNKLIDMITMMLGGRAAEEIVIKDISTGASNDIQRASTLARQMVTEWGMSERLGNMFLGGSQEVFLGRDYQTQHNYSESISGIIDDEIKKIIDECYKKAIEVLTANRAVLENLVKVLFNKETIYTDEVDMLFDGKTAEQVITFIEERIAKQELLRNVPKINIVEEGTKNGSEGLVDTVITPDGKIEKKLDDKVEKQADDKTQDEVFGLGSQQEEKPAEKQKKATTTKPTGKKTTTIDKESYNKNEKDKD